MNRRRFLKFLGLSSISVLFIGCGNEEPKPKETVNYTGKDIVDSTMFYAPYIPVSFQKTNEEIKLNEITTDGLKTSIQLAGDADRVLSIETKYMDPSDSRVFYQQKILKF